MVIVMFCRQGERNPREKSEMDNLEDLKILAEQWFHQGVEFVQQIPPTQLYAAIGVLLLTTILLLSSKCSRLCILLLIGLYKSCF